MDNPHTFCGFCGNKFSDTGWPKHCTSCGNVSYDGPVPVVNILVPIRGDRLGEPNLLLVRRNIDPGRGELALPGGFVDHKETWQQCAARELEEETSISIPEWSFILRGVESSQDKTKLLFFAEANISSIPCPSFVGNNEVESLVIATGPVETLWPSHTRYILRFFSDKHNRCWRRNSIFVAEERKD